MESAGEASRGFVFVFPNAFHDVARDADVERAVALAREYVDRCLLISVHLHPFQFVASWIPAGACPREGGGRNDIQDRNDEWNRTDRFEMVKIVNRNTPSGFRPSPE